MWTLLKATFYLIFAIFSPSSVFHILSFKNPALDTNCASIFLVSLYMISSPNLVLVMHSPAKQLNPSNQPDVDAVFSQFCNILTK